MACGLVRLIHLVPGLVLAVGLARALGLVPVLD